MKVDVHTPDDRRDAPPTSSARPASGNDEATALPLLRTWKAVYAFVTVIFVVYVVLLAALSKADW